MTGEARKKEDRYTHLTQTPVPRLITELSIPTIISMLVTGIYNTADTYFVGRISTNATAAVGVVFSVMALIQAFGFFCGHGSGNYMSRKLGAGESREASEMAATGFALAFIIGITFMIIGFVFLTPISFALGAMPEFIEDTQNYMCIILIGAPFMMAQFVVNNQLRFQGAPVYAMAGLVSGAVINIGLDPLLMFTFGMGVAGAAVATVCSQIISFVILFLGSRRGENVRIELKNIRLNGHYLFEIINGGLPSLFRQGLMSISTIALNHNAGIYGGAATIAGMSVTTRVSMLANSALIGFGQGFQPMCSFNYGAKRYERVREGFWFCVRYGTIFLLAVSTIGFVFAPQIIHFFREDAEVVAVGSVALRFQAVAFPLGAFLVMSNMMAQSIGKGVRASILASARTGFFFLPLIFLLPRLFGLFGVEITQACADVLAFLLAIPIARSILNEMREAETKQDA